MDIGLISLDKDTGLIKFGIGDSPPKLVGLNKLVQIVLITLLTSTGSDKFEDYGGGLMDLLGRPMNPSEITGIKSEIAIVVSSTQDQIISEQIDPNLPPRERLLRIDLIDVQLNRDLLELEITIRIINEEGDYAFVKL